MPTQISGSSVTTGSIDLTTPLAVADGGTGTGTFDTTLKTQLNATGDAPIYACRAWINFNGTGTVAIRASGNVSSVTDNGVGDYTVNFTTAMQDANYGYSHGYSSELNIQVAVGFLSSILSTSIRVQHYNAANSSNTADKSVVVIAIFR